MAITRIPETSDEEHHEEHTQYAHLQPSQSLDHHNSHHHSLSNASTATVDIEAWTIAALESLNIAPVARGIGNALSIPLDEQAPHRSAADHDPGATPQMKLRGVKFGDDDDAYGASITPPRRPPSRRDSLRKREALLKGKEGSRQRRRWENDHLIGVPNAQPPLPCDWEIRPTYPILPPVPYQLAQYWDNKARSAPTTRSKSSRGDKSETQSTVGHVPRDLRATAKRTPAVKSWLRVLEEPVRQFVVERGLLAASVKEKIVSNDNKRPSDESEGGDEDEIVFKGRRELRRGSAGASVHEGSSKLTQQQGALSSEQGVGHQLVENGMVLETEDDASGAFKRWLTHSISDYYGLDSKSITVGNPARRIVYIGIKQKQSPRRKPPASRPVLPPPLWEMF